ncbi:Leucine rich repeat protein [Handroanthus impetiginosus]|uniref:Leucine rich repeat protein n=1 Tax=Handroanthus impetiginosus TaxID=429701 RepID=A0A2G9I2J6_9LAMI|nr:Leucine rich repeat protein [Handroanthus impetiginosus]
MSKVFDFTDVDKFCPGGFLPSKKDSSSFLSLGNHVDVYFLPRKRSRICAPFVVSEEPKQQPSIEVLPDECLFEIFRRLPDGQGRSASACVSKRWLMLLSSIRRDELCTAKVPQFTEPKIQSNPQKANDSAVPNEKCEFDDSAEKKSEDEEFVKTDSYGYLSRCLEGKKATDVRLAAIAVGTASRGGLGKLSIRGSTSTRKLTSLGFKAISRGCPSLRVLSLWNLSSLGDEGLYEVASGCHSLEKLDLSCCPAITDKGLIAIAMNCPNLMSVTLESCSNIGNESLKALGRCCPNLKCITIKNCPRIGDQGIASLFSSAGHIMTKAKLQALNISDVSLAVIGHYGSAMTDLALVGLQNVNERGFWVMGKGQGLQKLKSLSITACPGASDLGLEVVGKGCRDLKLFALRKCPHVSDNGIVSFAKAAESLESLQLEECHRITQCGVFGVLTNCGEKLKALALANCSSVQDLGFKFPSMSPCYSLCSLTIHNCPGFGDAGLGMIGRLCPKLTQLDLSGIQGVTDAGVLPLIQNSEAGLVKVSLSGCVNLTDNAVTAIAKLHGETLELLNLDGCNYITDMSLMAIARNCWVLSELDVSQCGITDSGIAVLAAAEQITLQMLSLAGCSLVSDKSFPFLLLLGKTLVGLNIQHCRGLSSGTIDLLLDQIWRCDILS